MADSFKAEKDTDGNIKISWKETSTSRETLSFILKPNLENFKKPVTMAADVTAAANTKDIKTKS
jgi:hypothetical protein